MPVHRGLGFKRVIDLLVSALALVITLPVMLIASLLIVIEDRGPVFYRQKRIGRSARPVELLKLRSMKVNSADPIALGQVREQHPLVTHTGRVLRRFKIDELPQLINILKGEMSLVGPRPALPEHVQHYDDFQKRRLIMRPGLTGWAQVNGNTQLSWPERIVLDVWYLDHWSLWFDFKIMIKTVKVIFCYESPNQQALLEAWKHADRTCRGR